MWGTTHQSRGRSSGLRSVGLEVWARSPAMSPPFARRAFLSAKAREGGNLASLAGSALRVDGNDRCPDDGGGEDSDDVPVSSCSKHLFNPHNHLMRLSLTGFTLVIIQVILKAFSRAICSHRSSCPVCPWAGPFACQPDISPDETSVVRPTMQPRFEEAVGINQA